MMPFIFFQFYIFMDNSPYWDMVFNVFLFTLITHPSSCSPHLMHHHKVFQCSFLFVNKCFKCTCIISLSFPSFSTAIHSKQSNLCTVFLSANFPGRYLFTVRGLWTLFPVISVSGVQGVLVIFSILVVLIL